MVATISAPRHRRQCHALAITVGDGEEPRCDTFMESGTKGGDESAVGKVGACKVSVCKHNESLECSAGQIEVGIKARTACCITFEL
jgi:hypothetical protein